MHTKSSLKNGDYKAPRYQIINTKQAPLKGDYEYETKAIDMRL